MFQYLAHFKIRISLGPLFSLNSNYNPFILFITYIIIYPIMPATATSRCRQLKNYKTYTILLDLKVSPMSDISKKTSDEFLMVPYIPVNLFKLL